MLNFFGAFKKLLILQANGLLRESQFRFCKGHSTTKALQKFMEPITRGMDRGKTPPSVFIDIGKAFDTVDFQTLVSRMESLDVHRMTWTQQHCQ